MTSGSSYFNNGNAYTAGRKFRLTGSNLIVLEGFHIVYGQQAANDDNAMVPTRVYGLIKA